MPNIFISYRRADSSAHVGRIYDRLVEAFGKKHIFKDVDNIPVGVDFRQVLSREVNKCDIVLVVIGRSWMTVTDDYGRRRIDNPDDFVRIEVATALARQNCLVVPVLLQGAPMPPPNYLPPDLQMLPYKNAAIVRDDPDFHHDLTRLVIGLGGKPAGYTNKTKRRGLFTNLFLTILFLLLLGGITIVIINEISKRIDGIQPTDSGDNLVRSSFVSVGSVANHFGTNVVMTVYVANPQTVSGFSVQVMNDAGDNLIQNISSLDRVDDETLTFDANGISSGTYLLRLFAYDNNSNIIDIDDMTLAYYP
jgi:hypothetical protein